MLFKENAFMQNLTKHVLSPSTQPDIINCMHNVVTLLRWPDVGSVVTHTGPLQQWEHYV